MRYTYQTMDPRPRTLKLSLARIFAEIMCSCTRIAGAGRVHKDRSARSQAAETDVVKQHGSGNTVEFSCGTAAQGKSRNVLSVAWMRKPQGQAAV